MTVLRRIWFFITRSRRLSDLDEEMRLHVELRAAANRQSGLETCRAGRAARLRFGSLLKLRDEVRDEWGFTVLDRVSGDLLHAVRHVVHRPARTLVLVLTLALGIGATTAMFTLVDTMLLKPAPWNRAGRLVWIATLKGRSAGTRNVSYPDYLVLRDRARTLSGVAAFGGTSMSVGGRQPRRVLGGVISANLFDVLGIRAQIGRMFVPTEHELPSTHPVVVLSDALWSEQFGRDPAVINSLIPINGQSFTIVGVAPRGFTGVAYADDPEQLWVPMGMQRAVMPANPTLLTDANAGWLRVVGRLRDGASIADADADVRVIARQLNPPETPPDQEKSARVLAMRGGLTPWEQDGLAPRFELISIAPVLVLLAACANAANVLMAHHISRRREFAMRQAIGASRGRLIRQLLAESLVVAVSAGFGGFAVSFGLAAVVMHYGEVPAEVAVLLTPGGRSFIAATAAALMTIMVFGLVPALTASQFEVLPVLKDEETSTASYGAVRLRRVSVIAQVALSLTLLITAELFLQSLLRTMRVDPGFDPRHLAVASFDLNLQGYGPDRRAAFVSRLVERASALPDVVSAATANVLPLGGQMYGATAVSETGARSTQTTLAGVSPRYFETLGQALVAGREFIQVEAATDARVAIVNETLARRLWPGRNPVGQRVRDAGSGEHWRDVIAVAHDTKYLFLTESPRPVYYVPMREHGAASLIVRTRGNPRAVLSSLTTIAHDLDPDLPLSELRTMEERIRRSVNVQRAVVSLLGVLGSLTLLLASVGIYGVAAHSVSLRTREVGIRMALGARATDVLRMVVRESISVSLIGVAIGLGMSAAGSLILASFLFGLTTADALTFAAGSAILCLVTMVASYIPARRAAYVDPVLMLRHD